MPDSAFNLKGTLLCDVKIDGQPLVGEVQDGNFENMQALKDATNSSTDSFKDNAAVMKEFGDVLPEIIKNLRNMNSLVQTTNQNLPSVRKTITSQEQKSKELSEYNRQNFLQLVNSGSNAVQSIANGNFGGAVVGGVNSVANTSNTLAKMANVEDMTGLAKGLIAGGIVATVAGLVIKGGDTLANKFIDEMPTVYGTGRAFGDTSDYGALSKYHALNQYNKGTGLDIETFQGLAQTLRKQGVGNGLRDEEVLPYVGNIANTVGRWAYATGGSAEQYASLAGLMSRYGGSTNVSEDFNRIVSAGYASGLEDTQIPEFLSGIQKVMEDGIAKGFSRSATEVADTLLMFSKMSGNNAFWQGEQGAKLLNQANSGIANATNLAKTEDILVYQAFSQAYRNEAAIKEGIKKRNGSYIQGAEYSNMMQLIEGGITGDNWNQLRGIIDSSYGSEDEKIEALRSMTGLNYTGAARLWGLGETTSETKLKEVLTAPENKNDQTRYQEAVNDIKDAVVRIGSKAADIKIEGMELVSKGVTALANHFVKEDTGIVEISNNPTEQELWDNNVGDDALHGYSVNGAWTNVKKIKAKDTDAIIDYLGNEEYDEFIDKITKGNSVDKQLLLNFIKEGKLEQAQYVRNQIQEETGGDTPGVVYEKEREQTKQLLQDLQDLIVDMKKNGLTIYNK